MAQKWFPGLQLSQDPEAVLDYTFDFSAWLAGETISGVVVTGTNCTAGAATVVGSTAKVRVSAVLTGATVRLRVTTSSGQINDFTTKFVPVTS